MNACKNGTELSIQIYENRTYRAVQRCFTCSAIFSFNANVFPNDDIFTMVKIIGFFYNRTYMRKRPFCNIMLTVWFKESDSFSISTSFGTISIDFDIFHYFLMKLSEYIWFTSIYTIFHSFFRCYGLNACEMPVPMSELNIAGVRHDWFP